jgi:glycosyltransferase involved in cell wall biosynthesis
MAARRCGIPHVWYVHEMLDQDPVLQPFLPFDYFYRLMDALSFRIILVANALTRQFGSHVSPGKLEVIHTGIPEVNHPVIEQPKQKLWNLPADAPVITFAGLLSERKGVVDFVDSAPRVLEKFPQATFVLAGPDGGRRREVMAKIHEHGMASSFRLLGIRHDIPDILAASDMLVLPSLVDPLPLVVLEAMQAGIPVVATRSGGAEEMVEDGVTGYLVPTKSHDRLADAILAMLNNDGRRKVMGQRGRQRGLDEFSYSRYLAAFERVLNEACSMDRQSLGVMPDDLYHQTLTELMAAAICQSRRLAKQAHGIRGMGDRLESVLRRLSLV